MSDETIRTVITLHHCGATPDPVTRHEYADLALSELEAIESGVEQVAKGHIEVKLDFIPVEERLPEEDVDVIVMLRGKHMWCYHRARYGSRHISGRGWYTVFPDVNNGNEIESDFREEPTHWAEIPTIEAQS